MTKMGQSVFIPLEYEDQKAIFEWSELMEAKYPELELLKGSLMGVNISKTARGKAKKCGVKKGWPDITLPISRSGYNSLFIELKREKGGKVSEEQKRCLKLLSKYGNYACVCEGREAAKEIILKYLRDEL